MSGATNVHHKGNEHKTHPTFDKWATIIVLDKKGKQVEDEERINICLMFELNTNTIGILTKNLGQSSQRNYKNIRL